MEKVIRLLLLIAGLQLWSGCDTLSLNSYLTAEDKAKLKLVFEAASPLTDLQTAYYDVLGYKILGETIPKAADICKFAQSKVDAKNIESIYYASGLSKALGNCPLTTANFQTTINGAIADGATSQILYYAVSASKNLGINVDSPKVSKILTASRKNDDSAQSLGYAFHVASQLTGDVSSFVSWIEDTVVQADEVDGQLLQFEGGLSLSAIVISGIYKLADHANKAPPGLNGEKCLKFTNYLLSRKQVQQVRAAYYLLYTLQTLSNNKYHIPISVSITTPFVHVNKPVIKLFISNAFGSSLGQISGTVETATKTGETTAVTIKKPLTPVKDQPSYFEFDLTPYKLGRGFHQLSINAAPPKPDARWVGNLGAKAIVKIITEVVIENVEIGVLDVDQTTPSKLTQMKYPEKFSSVLEADYHQKLHLKFALKDKAANQAMTVHQAFVVLNHVDSGREIIFVADTDSANTYKFDLEIQGKSKLFGSLSGSYRLSIIVGDSVISNPVLWHLADVSITFQDPVILPRETEDEQKPKPEIKHVFREPDKRPPNVVSTTFSGLTLVPLLLLVILWIKIGANVSEFKLNLGTIGFHVGLASIFGLFTLFWLKLTMFETLKYLIFVGIVTFLCGNCMLSKIAAAHK
ncbi:proteasome regulatory particle base subunit [Chamberlinius hualienensis]